MQTLNKLTLEDVSKMRLVRELPGCVKEYMNERGVYICQKCGSTNTEVQEENDVDWVCCEDCGHLESHWRTDREY